MQCFLLGILYEWESVCKMSSFFRQRWISLWIHTELTAWNASQLEVWKRCGSLTGKRWQQEAHDSPQIFDLFFFSLQGIAIKCNTLQRKLPVHFSCCSKYRYTTYMLTTGISRKYKSPSKRQSESGLLFRISSWLTDSRPFFVAVCTMRKKFNLYAIILNRN